MKKLYIAFLLVSLSGISFAQSTFIISTKLTPVADMVTAQGTDVTGDTVEFFNSDEYSLITAPLMVVNPNGTTKTIRVRRTILSVISGSSNYFCWDLCYSPGVSVSGTLPVAANDTNVSNFYADYDPLGNSGTTYINYKFYNDGDTTEFASTTVKFTSGTVGIEDQELIISNVYPNPASDFINFDYILGNHKGKITIADMTGKTVRSAILPEGSTKHSFSLEGLTEGIYIYTFYGDNKAISTRKFII